MAVTQEAILSLLIEEGGKVKNSDFLSKFKGAVNCADPAEKKRNRELFKTIVNNVAVVKEIDDVKYVVVRKKYQHLLKENQESDQGRHSEKNTEEEELLRVPVDAQHEHEHHPQSAHTAAANKETPAEGAGGETSVCESSQEEVQGNSNENEPLTPAELPSPVALALQRIGKFENFNLKPKRALYFDIVQDSDPKGESRPSGEALGLNKTTATHSKPFALPLRMPPTKIEVHRLKGSESDAPPEKSNPDTDPYDSFRHKRKPSVESPNLNSPQPRRSVKSTKPSEEPKESSRAPSTVPLEQSEHEWLVKSASGHWSQVYGMLLNDHQLAEKRDFMSGFTALHWAAKCGNSDMLSKMIEISRDRGAEIDINAKTHGGYTPLHIAALHDQEYILAKLVEEYGADVNVRDNCGKRAYHYLHKGISERVRGLLGEPKAPPAQESVQQEKDEVDLFPDLSKGLHTISRLFQPHMTGHKKKHKQRPGIYSLSDDPREEREESGS